MNEENKKLWEGLKTIRDDQGTYNWSNFNTPENFQAIANLCKEDFEKFKEQMEEVDCGMTHPFIRSAYALNPNEDVQELCRGMMDENKNVALMVVQNANCPQKLLLAAVQGDEEMLGQDVMLDYLLGNYSEIIQEAAVHLNAMLAGEAYNPRFPLPIYNLPV